MDGDIMNRASYEFFRNLTKKEYVKGYLVGLSSACTFRGKEEV